MEIETYVDANGLRRCTVCNALKQVRIFGKVIPCICNCEEAADKAEAEHRQAEAIKAEHKRNAFQDGTETVIRSATFANDNGKTGKLMSYCKGYAEGFTTSSAWLVLYGDVGVGKSYAAAAIANHLLENCFSVRFTTLTQFERKLWNAQNKDAVYAEYRWCDLLVLDDLGISRATQYMNEILFTLVDERLQSGKPMIVTTNMSAKEMLQNDDTSIKRIMSRLVQKSTMIECKGKDQRLEAFMQRGALTFDE